MRVFYWTIKLFYFNISFMKQLTDTDIANMVGDNFYADENSIKKQVRSELKLSRLAQSPTPDIPKRIRIDFHNKTVEESWELLCNAVHSGARDITVITGASGVLKPEFQKWIKQSVISDLIIDCKQLNNGSFDIKIKKQIT